MKKGLSLALVTIFALTILLTGCGNGEQVESDPESSSAAQIETTTSSESTSYSEPETSEQDIALEEPEESDSNAAPESGEPETEQDEEENSEMQMNVQIGGNTFTAALEENEAVALFQRQCNFTWGILKNKKQDGIFLLYNRFANKIHKREGAVL